MTVPQPQSDLGQEWVTITSSEGHEAVVLEESVPAWEDAGWKVKKGKPAEAAQPAASVKSEKK